MTTYILGWLVILVIIFMLHGVPTNVSVNSTDHKRNILLFGLLLLIALK